MFLPLQSQCILEWRSAAALWQAKSSEMLRLLMVMWWQVFDLFFGIFDLFGTLLVFHVCFENNQCHKTCGKLLGWFNIKLLCPPAYGQRRGRCGMFITVWLVNILIRHKDFFFTLVWLVNVLIKKKQKWNEDTWWYLWLFLLVLSMYQKNASWLQLMITFTIDQSI